MAMLKLAFVIFTIFVSLLLIRGLTMALPSLPDEFSGFAPLIVLLSIAMIVIFIIKLF
jgi:hypothetical protein